MSAAGVGSQLARQSGSALVMAIFFTALLGSLGIALLFLGVNNLKLSRVQLDVKKSFFLAEAGVEQGRRALQDAIGATGELDDQLLAAAGPDGVLDFDAATLVAVTDSAGNFTGLGGYDDDVPLQADAPLGEGFFATFLTNDPIDGRASLADSNSRVMVTGVGIGPNHSFRLVEAILEPEILLPQLPPAAVVLLGQQPTFVGGASNAEKYYGQDCKVLGGGVPGLNVGIVGAVSDAAELLIEAGMTGPANKYTSGGHSGIATGVNLLDPTEPLLAAGPGTMDPAWNDCAFLQELLEKLADHATHYCAGNACSIPSPTNDDDIVFINGDVQVGPGGIGSGILVVTGELKVLGNTSWKGMMLVIGEGALKRQGGGNGYISGATIVADIAGLNGVYGDGDDCQPDNVADTDPFGNSKYTVVGGGNSDIDFCSRFQFNGPRGYRVVDFRQR